MPYPLEAGSSRGARLLPKVAPAALQQAAPPHRLQLGQPRPWHSVPEPLGVIQLAKVGQHTWEPPQRGGSRGMTTGTGRGSGCLHGTAQVSCPSHGTGLHPPVCPLPWVQAPRSRAGARPASSTRAAQQHPHVQPAPGTLLGPSWGLGPRSPAAACKSCTLMGSGPFRESWSCQSLCPVRSFRVKLFVLQHLLLPPPLRS